MSKHETLTEEEVRGFVFDTSLAGSIEKRRLALGIAAEEMNILDWGCGRGLSVAWLRQRGYNAYGVDVDAAVLEKGVGYFQKPGISSDAALSLLSERNETVFEDDYFHFVFSNQVIEHIRDIDSAAREMGRITSRGGAACHVFPAHRCLIEPHLLMPVIHWFPKSSFRRFLIALFLMAGRDPGWKELSGKSIAEKANAYFEYSVSRTYYRNWKSLRNVFEANRFDVGFTTLDGSRVEKKKLLKGLVKTRIIGRLVYAIHLRFSPMLEMTAVKK